MVMPAGMVYGVVLAPGERVVYFHREDPGWQKPLLIVVGILMLVGIVGIFILAAGLMAKTTVYVITTRRLIKIEGKSVEEILFDDVKKMTRDMTNSIVKWVHLDDAKGKRISWQVACNKPGIDNTIQGYLDDRSSLERAETVAHANLRDDQKQKPKK